MKRNTLFGTIVSAAILTAGSIAMAQQSPGGGSGAGGAAGPGGTAPMPSQAAPTTPGSSGSGAGTMSPSSPTTPRPDMSTQAPSMTGSPPESVVGKSVTNAAGEDIGEISAVIGNQVVVEVGGFLGIGARDVALDWSQITPTGTGNDMKLQTTLTKDELQAMPEYKK